MSGDLACIVDLKGINDGYAESCETSVFRSTIGPPFSHRKPCASCPQGEDTPTICVLELCHTRYCTDRRPQLQGLSSRHSSTESHGAYETGNIGATHDLSRIVNHPCRRSIASQVPRSVAFHDPNGRREDSITGKIRLTNHLASVV